MAANSVVVSLTVSADILFPWRAEQVSNWFLTPSQLCSCLHHFELLSGNHVIIFFVAHGRHLTFFSTFALPVSSSPLSIFSGSSSSYLSKCNKYALVAWPYPRFTDKTIAATITIITTKVKAVGGCRSETDETECSILDDRGQNVSVCWFSIFSPTLSEVGIDFLSSYHSVEVFHKERFLPPLRLPLTQAQSCRSAAKAGNRIGAWARFYPLLSQRMQVLGLWGTSRNTSKQQLTHTDKREEP